ncbi:MAG: hypothetical protein ACTHKG_00595 [Nocardioides sp.]
MATFLVVGFLMVHGLLHLAVWLPHPDPRPEHPAPFEPDHSRVLTAVHVEQQTTHRVAVVLAVAAATVYVVSGLAVWIGLSSAAAIVALAAVIGLAMKVLYFDPWLLIGIGLDAMALTSAVAGWPVTVA